MTRSELTLLARKLRAITYRIRKCNGYREGEGDLWLGTPLHEIDDIAEKMEGDQ
ncbi:MAG: hypothetical protein GY722_07075 [bacterium]|nr:hypothetical protein [bacterium]